MDFNSAIETFAEAWVEANSKGPAKTSKLMLPAVNLPPMLSKEQMMKRGVDDKVDYSKTLTQHLSSNSPLAREGWPAKSIPIHCVVEQTPSGADSSAEPQVELDTYAILPGATLFSEIVRTALIKIGYTACEATAAKGAIQIKHWKALTFDTITENPDCTVEEVLGELTSVATLRIRLCSQSRLGAMEDVKDKLLQFLLQHSQTVLLNSGCPIEKTLLNQISRGDFSQTLPDETREAFQKWYREHCHMIQKPQNLSQEGADGGEVARDGNTTPANFTNTTPVNFANTTPANFPRTMEARSSDPFAASRTRFRTSFDAENEIPRLQKWFKHNEHPSREQMAVYLEELNNLESRKGRKPLDLTNIIYWFKNARAAARRATPLGAVGKTIEGGGEDQSYTETEESLDGRVSPCSDVPVLPNRNAVYVVKPVHCPPEEKVEVVHINDEAIQDMDAGEESPEPRDFSKHSRHVSPGERLQDENHNTPVSLAAHQEEATDLRLHTRKRKDSSDSGLTHDSLNDSSRSVRIKLEKENEEYLSSSNPATPSPKLPSSAGREQHSPNSAHMRQQQALQMAAMSHAINLHYMHPLYRMEGPPPTTPLSYKDSDGSPNSSYDSERKKRSRVFIDPLSEIPKLEKWFMEDTHPSSYMIEKYTEELNRSAYRQRFPKLEPKNVQLWFKNHRARVKRQRLEVS